MVFLLHVGSRKPAALSGGTLTIGKSLLEFQFQLKKKCIFISSHSQEMGPIMKNTCVFGASHSSDKSSRGITGNGVATSFRNIII